MDCSSCGAINPDGKSFCGKCGAALLQRCPACGCSNPGGMNFCGDCGASLTAKDRASAVGGSAAPRATRSEAERRHLTVMFCDLVDSTVLAAKLDPEDLAEVIRRFQATCVAAIEHGGGHVARFMGDGILAYFGYPQASEDDAERGVRAGLDLVAKISQPLALRVGIATGLVFVGETVQGQAQEQAAVGITPNLAARLQSVAQPNAVLVAESTCRLLGRVFATEAARSYALKGFPEPVLAWRVIGERLVETRFDAQHAGSLTRFVGRQHEIHELMELWQRAKTGAGQVALLCGEAGIGKSRISRILQESIGESVHVRIRYQCSPYHANSPLHPVINQLEHAAGIEGADGPAARLAKL